MTTFHLIRHATCDAVGHSLAGRAAGMSLNAEGRRDAARLAERLRAIPLDAIYTSPLERATETAAAIGAVRELPPDPLEELTEFDFGGWTGRSIASLRDDPHWRAFNVSRSGTSAPGGESAIEVQARVVGAMMRLRDAHPGGSVALVSHAEAIRLSVAYFLGVPIDLALRIEIDPASISILELDDWGPRVLAVNSCVDR